jgi:uncharacterized protein YwqG
VRWRQWVTPLVFISAAWQGSASLPRRARYLLSTRGHAQEGGSMDKASIAVAMQQSGLGRLTSVVDQLTLPSIRISTNPSFETAIPLGESKFGGLPDLPATVAWPEMNGTPMEFIAQIQFADVQEFDAAHALPAQGLLLFFYDATQQTFGADPNDRAGVRALYLTQPTAALKRRDVPDDLPPAGRSRVCSVSFSQELTLTLQPNLEIASLPWSDEDQEHYDAALQQVVGAPSHPIHRLLGHPDTIQDDMRSECQFAANGIADPGSAPDQVAKLTPGVHDWILLLQVDSDPDVGMRWANAGMLYFWIRRQDLASGTFDHVWVVLQSE